MLFFKGAGVGLADTFAEKFIDAVNAMTADLSSVYQGSHHYTVSGWHTLQVGLVSATGAGAAAIPVLHITTAIADIAFLVNRLGTASYGIGAILGHQAGLGNILDEEDMAAVILYWVGADDFKSAMGQAALGKGSAIATPLVLGSPAAVKLGIKAMMHSLGYLVGQKAAGKAAAKLSSKVASKLATKVTARLSGKVLTGFVPILGAIVGAATNAWLLDGLIHAAKDYYADKLRLLQGGSTALTSR